MAPQDRPSTTVLVVLTLAALPGFFLAALVVVGPVSVLLSLAGLAVLVFHTGAARRGGAVASALYLSAVVGAGTWGTGLVVGVAAGLLPFLTAGDHPHKDLWWALCAVAGIAAAGGAWTVARRVTRQLGQAGAAAAHP